MILEEETYEKFRYYPSDLAPQSHKKILAICDDCGKIREVEKRHYYNLCILCGCKKRHHIGFLGKKHSEESKRIMRKKHKGQKSPMLGKHHSDVAKRKNREAHLGKHPSEETKKKLSKANKGEKNPNFGKHHSESVKKQISKARKGKYHTKEAKKRISKANKGRKHNELTKQKIGKAHRGKYVSNETRDKIRKARKHQKMPTHHTKPELIFEQICKKNNLPFKYTGDGSFWIGNINPDFIECNGKKIAIEIFSYWHDPLRRHCKVRYTHTYEGRKKILKKHKWKLVVFWQEDLERKDVEQFVLLTLKKYL